MIPCFPIRSDSCKQQSRIGDRYNPDSYAVEDAWGRDDELGLWLVRLVQSCLSGSVYAWVDHVRADRTQPIVRCSQFLRLHAVGWPASQHRYNQTA